ncbi:MAG TPA: hypothetical protein VNA69_07315 [Thermoanaerobaculia bacterium]|nr:hypothetical protein [Thermoanaerobaculia bacterium]
MRNTIVVLACILSLACGTSTPPDAGSAPSVKVVQPEILFLQLVGPADLNFPTGSMQVKYGMRIENRWSEPITLRSITLASSGTGGPYILKRDTYFFGKKIEAAQSGDVIWWATAVARGNPFAVDAEAPVSVRAIAYFETESGAFRKVLWRDFGQFGAGARTGN